MINVLVKWDTFGATIVTHNYFGFAPMGHTVEGPFCCMDMAEYHLTDKRQAPCGCAAPVITLQHKQPRKEKTMIASDTMTIGSARPATGRTIHIKQLNGGFAYIKDATTGGVYVPSTGTWVREDTFETSDDYAGCLFDTPRGAEEYVIINDLGKVRECTNNSTVIFALI